MFNVISICCQGCAWCPAACVAVARGGRLHTLKWLRENLGNKCWDEASWRKTMQAAARNGDLEMVKWLAEEEVQWWEEQAGTDAKASTTTFASSSTSTSTSTSPTSSIAARTCSAFSASASLSLCTPSHTHPHDWRPILSVVAAEGGHLRVLKWLHDQSVPLHPTAYTGASRGAHINVSSVALTSPKGSWCVHSSLRCLSPSFSS